MTSKREAESHVPGTQGEQRGNYNTQNNVFLNLSHHYVGRRTAIVILIAAAVLAVSTPVALHRILAKPSIAGKSAPDTLPRPASSSSPPVIVESVSELKSISADGSLALPRPLRMTAPELTSFNNRVIPNSPMYSAWYTKNDAAAVHSGVTTLTLRGNATERVHIVDMRVLKDCTRPFNGTYFQGYTQGSGTTAKLAFDLDSPNPMPQQVAVGFVPLGVNFFDQEYVALSPGETITLAIAAFTKHYACRFHLQLIVATAQGTFSEDIDNDGKPFIVTAKAAPTRHGRPYSGYQSAYVYSAPNGVPVGWKKVNPTTYP